MSDLQANLGEVAVEEILLWLIDQEAQLKILRLQ